MVLKIIFTENNTAHNTYYNHLIKHAKNNLLRDIQCLQGSVLAPLLFNVYTNDQPIHPGTRSFVYADDLVVTTQSTDFAPIEETLTSAVNGLSEYYPTNQLRANPTKTQVSLFHLRNRECGKQLNISWNGVNLTPCNLPVYLGVTLDRTLSYKAHIENTKKVGTRNNIIRKLRTSKCGATPTTLRSSDLALWYSAAEYACPVWERSTHTKKLDATLNETCRMITGCLKPTNTNSLPVLAGIAPPYIRMVVKTICFGGDQTAHVVLILQQSNKTL